MELKNEQYLSFFEFANSIVEASKGGWKTGIVRSFEGRRIGLALTRSSIPPRKRKRLKKRLLSAISMGGKIDSSILGVYIYIYTYMYVCMYIYIAIYMVFLPWSITRYRAKR